MDLQPQQAAFMLQMFLPAIKNESKTTKRVIEAVPVDKGDYAPDPISMKALDLCWHIAFAEHMFYSGVANGQFDYSNSKRPDNVKNSADVARWYEETFARDFEALTKMSPESLLKSINFAGRFDYPAIQYVQFGMVHTIHHRGQLSAYLRPMGAKVPAIYGESYDSKAAQTAQG